MKKFSNYRCLLVVFLAFTSCYGQEPVVYGPNYDPPGQVSQYIRRMLRDSKGNLWFGTNGEGVCRYDGTSLDYFSLKEGFAGTAVRGIAEDNGGNIWFATESGVSMYDGTSFRRFAEKEGLSSTDTWSLYKDRSGVIWVGTYKGLCRFDGIAFVPFPLPASGIENPVSRFTTDLVWSVFEDKTGKFWFGTDGAGLYRHDPATGTFMHFSEKEGLCNNNVSCILEDRNGKLWFGTRFGGVSSYDPSTGVFTNFTGKDGLGGDFIYTIIEDKNGNLWLSVLAGGVCRYDGSSFTCYGDKEGLTNHHVQSILEDPTVPAEETSIWIGTSGGLFRFNGTIFTNVLKNGPWK